VYIFYSWRFWADFVGNPGDNTDRTMSYLSAAICLVVAIALILALPWLDSLWVSISIMIGAGIAFHVLGSLAYWGQDLANMKYDLAFWLGYLGWWGSMTMVVAAALALFTAFILIPIFGV